MSMTFLGVPIFDWVLLVVVLGLGVEAWITCRVTDDDKADDLPPVLPPSAQGDSNGGVGKPR